MPEYMRTNTLATNHNSKHCIIVICENIQGVEKQVMD